MYTADELEAWFKQHPVWNVSAEGLWLRATETTPEATLPFAALSVIHPDFPLAIAELPHHLCQAYGLPYPAPWYLGRFLQSQLYLYRYPARGLPVRDTTLYIQSLYEVTWLNEATSVKLVFNGYEVACAPSTTNAAVSLRLVLREAVVKTLAPVSWMDNNYPGWRERYSAGVALAFTPAWIACMVETIPTAMPSMLLPEQISPGGQT